MTAPKKVETDLIQLSMLSQNEKWWWESALISFQAWIAGVWADLSRFHHIRASLDLLLVSLRSREAGHIPLKPREAQVLIWDVIRLHIGSFCHFMHEMASEMRKGCCAMVGTCIWGRGIILINAWCSCITSEDHLYHIQLAKYPISSPGDKVTWVSPILLIRPIHVAISKIARSP